MDEATFLANFRKKNQFYIGARKESLIVDNSARPLVRDNFIQDDLFANTLPDMATLIKSLTPRKGQTNEQRNEQRKEKTKKGRRIGSGAKFLENEIRIPPSQATGGAEVRVIRNPRRRKSISAYREQGAIVIQIPTHILRTQIADLIPEMVSKVLSREARERSTDSDLHARALELLATYLPEFSERPASVTWRPMLERWGSCTSTERTIRISDRLIHAPEYLLDYLLVHELIHLKIPDHGPRFIELLSRFEGGERAEAFLEGYESGARG